jgi:hypothetical protein
MTRELKKLVKELDLSMDVCGMGEHAWNASTISMWPEGSRHFWITLYRKHGEHELEKLETEYHMGPALKDDPTIEEVLSSLMSDASCADGETFEGFCDGLGYSSDSIKALNTYNACVKTARELRDLLGVHYDRVARAAADY